MKYFVVALLMVVTALYVSNCSIQLNPFKIRLETWHRGVAALLLWGAVFIYDVFESRYNYKKGFRDGIDYVIKGIKGDESREDIQK